MCTAISVSHNKVLSAFYQFVRDQQHECTCSLSRHVEFISPGNGFISKLWTFIFMLHCKHVAADSVASCENLGTRS